MLLEKINDFHCVFVRIHKDFISKQDSNPKASAFLNTPKDGDNLSCDWCKYCSSESSRQLIGKQKRADGTFKNPDVFFIWKLGVYSLRNDIVPQQEVVYQPIDFNPPNENIPNNLAHSIIIGQKPNNAEFRVALLKIGKWAIPPPSQQNNK